jgi:hypothetical protein
MYRPRLRTNRRASAKVIRLKIQRLQGAEGGDGYRQQGGLRVGGQFQFVLGTFETKPGKRKPERLIRLLEYLLRRGVLHGQSLAHAGELGALSREKKCCSRGQKAL